MRLNLGASHDPDLTLDLGGVGSIGSANQFNPQSLFIGGGTGFIYDNNDLTTMFVSSDGVVPAAVNGPVGLQLSKDAALAVGSDVRANGAIALLGVATAATYNTSTGVGTVTRVDVTNQSYIQFTGLTPETFYKMTFSAVSGGTLAIRNGTQAGITHAAVSTPSAVYVLADSLGRVAISSGSAATISFTVSALVSVAGKHRYQVTSTSRPVLRGTPAGAELVTNGTFASGLTGWTNPDTAPGTTTASGGGALMNNNTTGTARLRQAVTVPAGSYLLTFTVSGLTGATTATNLAVGSTTTGDSAYGSIPINANGTYTRYIDNVTGPTLGLAFIVVTGVGACSLIIDNVSVKSLSAASVTTPYGLQFDGVDDYLQTASINMSSSDSMSISLGARKLSDAAQAFVCELSVANTSNNGVFTVYAPVSAAANIGFASKGTALSLSTYANAAVAAPVTFVLTGIGDISSDTCLLRANGVQQVSAATDQGTGNYGNYVIYFGRRGGATGAFTGLLYGGACINKLLSTAELGSLERWVATRTGVTL